MKTLVFTAHIVASVLWPFNSCYALRGESIQHRHRGEGGTGGALAPSLFWLIKLLFQFFSKVLHKKVHRVILCQTCGPQRKHCFFLIAPLQKTKMSAVSGQRVANVTKQVLEKMRNNECFKSFYDTVLVKSKQHPSVSEPALPRQRRAPSRFEIGTGAPSYPTTPQDHYRRVYFEAIDLMVNAIDLRFNQASYRVYEKMESFLVKCLNCQDYSTELRYLEQITKTMLMLEP